MNHTGRSALRRFAVSISLTALLFTLALFAAACRPGKSPEGTSVTLSNGETAGVIVTMNPNESTEQGNESGSQAVPSESVSGTTSTGDDVIAAPTSPKNDASYSFRYQNVLILPGSDAASVIGSITEDCDITDSMETDKKGNNVYVRSYAFPNFVISARQDSEGRYIISRIVLSGRNSVTPEGIGIGAGSEDVIRTYGKNYADNGTSITYSSGTTDLTFFFANGAVTDITYNYNKLAA